MTGPDVPGDRAAPAGTRSPGRDGGDRMVPRYTVEQVREIPVREEVEIFSHAMEYKLRANDHKGGWENQSTPRLFELLKGEVKELEQALEGGNLLEVMLEAADVANYAMMIAWNAMKGKMLWRQKP